MEGLSGCPLPANWPDVGCRFACSHGIDSAAQPRGPPPASFRRLGRAKAAPLAIFLLTIATHCTSTGLVSFEKKLGSIMVCTLAVASIWAGICERWIGFMRSRWSGCARAPAANCSTQRESSRANNRLPLRYRKERLSVAICCRMRCNCDPRDTLKRCCSRVIYAASRSTTTWRLIALLSKKIASTVFL